MNDAGLQGHHSAQHDPKTPGGAECGSDDLQGVVGDDKASAAFADLDLAFNGISDFHFTD